MVRSTKPTKYGLQFLFDQDGNMDIELFWPDCEITESHIMNVASLLYVVNSGKLTQQCCNILLKQHPQYAKLIMDMWFKLDNNFKYLKNKTQQPYIQPYEVFTPPKKRKRG